MNNDQLLNQQIKRVLEKFPKSYKIFLCARLLVWLLVYRIRRVGARLLISPRARVHWVGYYRRSMRPERMLIVLLFASAMLLLHQREFLLWVAIWGGLTAIIINLYILYLLVPHKKFAYSNLK